MKIIYLFLFFLCGCAADINNSKYTSPTPAPVKTVVHQPSAVKVVYDKKLQNYISNHPAILQLNKIEPLWGQKLLHHDDCTIEKFIIGLNAPKIEVYKKTTNQLIIQTFGTKMGNGTIIIQINDVQAALISAQIGNIFQTNSDILKEMSKNTCLAADRK